MRAHGFAYTSPLNAIGDPRFRGSHPSRLEIRVATADVTCKRKTNLVGVWLAVESADQRQFISQNAAQYRAIRAFVDARARTAATILNNRP